MMTLFPLKCSRRAILLTLVMPFLASSIDLAWGMEYPLTEEERGVVGEKIAKALRKNKTGFYLELKNDEIPPRQLTTIAESLSHNTTVTHLNLRKNTLTSAQATEFAEKLGASLKSNTHLKNLSMKDMSIDAPGAIAIMEGGQNLSSLNLSRNKIGDDSLIAESLKKHPLLSFYIYRQTLWEKPPP